MLVNWTLFDVHILSCYRLSLQFCRHANTQQAQEQANDIDWWVVPSNVSGYIRSVFLIELLHHHTGAPHRSTTLLPFLYPPLPLLPQLNNSISLRQMATLSHLDSTGDPKMVDVSGKTPTLRTAVAEGHMNLTPKALELITNPALNPKGAVLGTAKLAAIMATKKTPELIPLCHTLLLSSVHVEFEVREEKLVVVRVSVTSKGNTGVEMEALTGVSVALLTVYDMTKSVSHNHTITSIRLISKTGGKTDLQNM